MRHNLAGVTYRPGDQDTWLFDPPWSPDDPAVQAWEAAHGHDVRTKCYVEYGCLVLEPDLDRQVEQARSIAVALEQETAELQRRIDVALALHRPRDMDFLPAGCGEAGDCDHTEECPTVPGRVCRECYHVGECASVYAWESPPKGGVVVWPCATAQALTAASARLEPPTPAHDPSCASLWPEDSPGVNLGRIELPTPEPGDKPMRPDRESYTAVRAFSAEGARIGLVSCLICGAALVLDPSDITADVLSRHTAWHAATSGEETSR